MGADPHRLVLRGADSPQHSGSKGTDLAQSGHFCRATGQSGRFHLKTFFSDQKSRGFHIHKSHFSDPMRISRLLIAACLAYIWMICLGLFVIAQDKTGLIDRTDRVDKSLFRLGLYWPKHVLKRGLPLDVHFFFQPAQFNEDVR
jgi:hypothetical protein